MDGQPKCPKCSQSMEQGYVADRNFDRSEVSTWIAGHPESSFWFGARTGGRDKLAITTYRCAKCGYLESFATK